jgi:DNA-binding MarR family transcriptional regulator
MLVECLLLEPPMKKSIFALEERLPYLTNRVASAVNELFSRDLAKLDLSIANWRVLTVLHDSGDQKLIDLSTHTSIDASTLSRLTESMHRRRLIAKKRSKLSKREITVTLTEHGRELVESLVPRALRYEQIMLEGLPDKDVETTRKMLRLMYQRVTDFRRSTCT